jgi:hypothetical protein
LELFYRGKFQHIEYNNEAGDAGFLYKINHKISYQNKSFPHLPFSKYKILYFHKCNKTFFVNTCCQATNCNKVQVLRSNTESNQTILYEEKIMEKLMRFWKIAGRFSPVFLEIIFLDAH